MSKKLIISLVMIGILAFGAGLGSYAWFTSEAVSSDNVFETGTLKIGDEEGEGRIVPTELGFDKIFPSWERTYSVEVENNGSLEFKYGIESITLKEGSELLYKGPNGLEISFDGTTFMSLDKVDYQYLGRIAAGKKGSFDVTFRLPYTAGDEFQGLSATLIINFYATQVENNDKWPIAAE